MGHGAGGVRDDRRIPGVGPALARRGGGRQSAASSGRADRRPCGLRRGRPSAAGRRSRRAGRRSPARCRAPRRARRLRLRRPRPRPWRDRVPLAPYLPNSAVRSGTPQVVVHDPAECSHHTNGRIVRPVAPDQDISARSCYELLWASSRGFRGALCRAPRPGDVRPGCGGGEAMSRTKTGLRRFSCSASGGRVNPAYGPTRLPISVSAGQRPYFLAGSTVPVESGSAYCLPCPTGGRAGRAYRATGWCEVRSEGGGQRG